MTDSIPNMDTIIELVGRIKKMEARLRQLESRENPPLGVMPVNFATPLEADMGVVVDKAIAPATLPLWQASAGNNNLQADLGGNIRGDYSIDLQTRRVAANRVASGVGAVIAGGQSNRAIGTDSHVEGGFNIASGANAHAEGLNNVATAGSAHAEGTTTTASAVDSHAEGTGTQANGISSHAEGGPCAGWAGSPIAGADCSHAEGIQTSTGGIGAHAEGAETVASGRSSHAEGYGTVASDESSHAEGEFTTASGRSSHAEGFSTVAAGDFSHAAGDHSATRLYAQYASASGYVSTGGDTQGCVYYLMTHTTTAIPKKLGIAVGTDLTVDANRAMACLINIVAKRVGSADCAKFTRDALIVNNAGTTTLVGTGTVGTDFLTAGMAGAGVVITASDPLDALIITVTGIADGVYWSCVVYTAEVVFP